MKNKKGMSIILVMAVLVILGAIAVAIITTSLTEVRVSRFTTDAKIAFQAAEAGIDYGISRLPTSWEAFPALPDTWVYLSNEAKYKSGLPDTLPAEIDVSNEPPPEGFSAEVFHNLIASFQSSGNLKKSDQVISVRTRCGPLSGRWTEY